MCERQFVYVESNDNAAALSWVPDGNDAKDGQHDAEGPESRLQGDARGDWVPMTVIRHKTVTLSGDNPTLLRAYGAYGMPLETKWSAPAYFLLKRGWVLAW